MRMNEWFQQGKAGGAGGIVVLPTGGGKTFTAVRFLCSGPLSQGYKVVWLAHTHHLLEQAFDSFAPRNAECAAALGVEVGNIAEPKTSVVLRVVSGTEGHFPVSEVDGDEDVLVITLQTLARAWERREELHGLNTFFKEAGPRLCVVFDEAHHSPAPGYRALIQDLREQHPRLLLLGLTATPTYTDERKRGWLKKLFPQGIVYQISARKLMADGVLARPVFEPVCTHVTPSFSQRDFQKWVCNFGDVPEHIIDNLANNRERNALIAQTYLDNRKRYGKTIIFAERWAQCEYLCELLKKSGVRVGAVYSHVDGKPGSAIERNRRSRDENHKVLDAFRADQLDVLINVRMLTEGTDVPKVGTVFITRETTSQILATQMVGRALRGPKFGGTEHAYIVSFSDNWQHQISFADFRQLEDSAADDAKRELGKRPPLQLISIELVRSLARMMDSGISVTGKPFLSLMPVGWYRVEYDNGGEGDDVNVISDLVMVYDDQQAGFAKFTAHLAEADLSEFKDIRCDMEQVTARLDGWRKRFFQSDIGRDVDEVHRCLADIARHMAQNDGQAPDFFSYEERHLHDLDAIAAGLIERDLGPRSLHEALSVEFHRKDRFWPALYMSFERFKSQADACINRQMMPLSAEAHRSTPLKREMPSMIPDREASEEIKEQVKRRDGYQCRCCGETNKKLLEVDHLTSFYLGGRNTLDNLQTLCRTCNQAKGVKEMNFMIARNAQQARPPAALPDFAMPDGIKAREREAWSTFLRRTINAYYRCAAVSDVNIGGKGRGFYEWKVELNDGNIVEWLAPYLKELVLKIRERIESNRNDGAIMERLSIAGPSQREVSWPLRSRR